MNLKKSVLLIVALFAVSAASAQGLANLRINELMVYNTDGVMDSHGERVGWIELYNSGYTTVNVAGCFISIAEDVVAPDGTRSVNRKAPGMTYRIPKSAQYRLDIPPQGYMLIFCGGDSNYGPFNTSFTLDKTGYVSVWDASGKGAPVASVRYDVEDQRENVSLVMNETEDGIAYTFSETVTPGHANFNEDGESKAEIMKDRDPYGIGMTVVAVFVVFMALILLYLIFRTVGKAMQRMDAPKKDAAPAANAPAAPKADKPTGDMNGEIAAAIAYALKAYQDELEAAEQMALTLNRVAKVYSPWSSKIHGLTREPERRR